MRDKFRGFADEAAASLQPLTPSAGACAAARHAAASDRDAADDTQEEAIVRLADYGRISR